MKIFFLAALLLLVFPLLASSNTVYMKTGLVYRNVTVDTSKQVAVIDLGYRKVAVDKSSIVENQWSPIDPSQTGQVEAMTPKVAKYFGVTLPDSLAQVEQKKAEDEKASSAGTQSSADAALLSTVAHLDNSVSTIKGVMIASLLISIGAVIATIIAMNK